MTSETDLSPSSRGVCTLTQSQEVFCSLQLAVFIGCLLFFLVWSYTRTT